MNERYAVLVAPCIISPGFQVATKNTHWNHMFINVMLEFDIDIIPLLCVESTFKGYDCGLKRNKHGIDYYSSNSDFIEHCNKASCAISKNILNMIKGGYKFIAILGIEHSPSCAVNYIYTYNKGMLKRSGLFFDSLKKDLSNIDISIPFIGINRRYPTKALKQLRNCIIISKSVRLGELT